MCTSAGSQVLACVLCVILVATTADALHSLASPLLRGIQKGRHDTETADEAKYARFDATLAQDITSSQMVGGQHQEASSFWTAHLQRAARAELALSVHMAAKRAEREHALKWHQHQGHRRRQRSAEDPVVIAGNGLFWPDLYGSTKDLGPDVCSVPCRWEVAPEQAERADIALTMPIFSPAEAHGKRRRPGQSLAIFSMEPVFGLTAKDMDGPLTQWDQMVTVSQHSDAVIGYADILHDILDGPEQEAFEAEHPLPEAFLNGPRGMIATFITSGCSKDPEDDWGSQYTARNRLVRDLTALGIGFDHYGGCKFGTEEAAAKLPSSQVEGASYGQLAGQRRKVQLMKAYRFVLGAENTVQVDYITEKFWQLFGSGRLPLYLGAPNAAAFAPPGSFISVLEHSPRQLARLLRHLSADEEAYAAYFEWRGGESQGGWVRHFNKAMHEHVAFGPRGDGLDWVCKLCKVQHKYYDWPEDTSTE